MNVEDEQKLNLQMRNLNITDVTEQKIIRQKAEVLLKQNEQLLQTVDLRLLTSKYDNIFNLLNIITVYPEIQEKIVGFSNTQYKIYSTILTNMDKNNLDWIGIAEDMADTISSNDLDNLFLDSIMKKKIENLYEKNIKDNLEQKEEAELEEITWAITNPHISKLKTYKEIKKIDLDKIYNDILIGKTEFSAHEGLSKNDKIKDIILRKKFGHGLEFAKFYLERYADDYDEISELIDNQELEEIYKYVKENTSLEHIDDIEKEVRQIEKENKVFKEYLTALKNIVETENSNKLQQYYAGIKKSVKKNVSYQMDSVARKFFCREKNKELYKPKAEDRTTIDNNTVYIIQDDFKMSMTSLMSYSNALDLDCKLVENHGLCITPIANNNLGTAPILGACLGFTEYEQRSLLVSAPYDVGSNAFTSKMNIAKAERIATEKSKSPTIKFHLPKNQINKIRSRHGEDVYERRELDVNKIDYVNEKFKKQPSYVVYFSKEGLNNYIDGDMNETLTAEKLRECLNINKLNDFEYRSEVIKNEMKDDKLWKKSLEEKEKRNVDIVVVDRTYFALKERLKLDELERKIMEFPVEQLEADPEKMNQFLNMIETLIVESENNRAGNSLGAGKHLIYEEIREKLFSSDIMDDRLEKIESKLASLSPDKAKLGDKKLKNITIEEINKYKESYFELDPGYCLEDFLEFCVKMEMEVGNQKFDINDSLNQVDKKTGKTGGEIVCDAICDIKDLQEYEASSSAIHGRKHINNVILFSYLIGKSEGTLGDNLDLLIQSAKFHDVGRDGNWNGQGDGKRHDLDKIKHAEPGALAAEFYMQKEHNADGTPKYNEDQIAIVQTAIHYHEVDERNRNEFNEQAFENMCEQYGVQESDRETAKLISIYLKDADAIDRTRFMWEYEEDKKTIPEQERYKRRVVDDLDISYLRRPVSLLIVPEAREMHKELLKKECEYEFDKKTRKAC